MITRNSDKFSKYGILSNSYKKKLLNLKSLLDKMYSNYVNKVNFAKDYKKTKRFQ